jgi:hypothetical protein
MLYDYVVFSFSLCECLIVLSFCCSSASNSGGTPPPERSRALGAPDIDGAPGAPEGHNPQVLVAGATSNDGTPIAEVFPEVDTTTTAGATTFHQWASQLLVARQPRLV